MGLEVATYIADLVATNPLTTDAVGQGDDHLRLIKSTILNTLPNMGGTFARVISVPAGYTVLATDNSALVEVPPATGATLTHTFSLPALASITAGFYVEHVSKGPTDFSIFVATGGATIEGAASMTLPPKTAARIYYNGTSWKAQRWPMYGATDSDISTAGGASISGTVFLGATLTVSGSVQVGGALSVSGAAHFKSSLSVSGDVTLGTLAVTSGATRLDGTLSVSSAAHFKSSISVGGASTLGGSLTVSGSASFNANVHVGTTLTVSGVATLASTLSVSGAAIFKSAVSVGGAVALASTLLVAGAAQFGSTVSISGTCALLSGNLVFPAVQNSNAGANVLDDYEEGTWTPTLTFVTVGNLSVVYSERVGSYTKIGRVVDLSVAIVTSTFTHTTASGACLITGLPFTTVSTASVYSIVQFSWQGITKANYTQVAGQIDPATTTCVVQASGSAQARANVTAADMPTGGTVILIASFTIFTA